MKQENSTKNEHLYTVGELCSAFQITRKTLFYYDRAGLLKPTERVGTQAFKVYDESAKDALQEILSFRDAGLTIAEIRAVRDEDCTDPLSILNRVLDRLQRERKEKEANIRHLKELMEQYRE